MEQFRSFDGAKFQKAIQEKDDISLKVSVVSAIRNDPTSAGGEANRALKMLREGCPEVFEPKRELKYEELHPDPNTWDEHYFLLYAAYVENNFCEERIRQLQEIGKKVYGKKEVPAGNYTRPQSTAAAQKMSQKAVQPKAATPQKAATPNPTRAPEQKKPPLAAGLLIVAVLVLVILVVCLLNNGNDAQTAAAMLNMPEALPLFAQQLTQLIK